ncbi:MAG: AAA family ATPase [Caldilineaceae bacterium SB0661_bin_32]|uniref:AAA family ATPase n=1 Tax=Caldilineaceae bacterium SB0661_bin_32 TaxID=2605255 RepID=A0A6B1D1U4_9CHLR|nr:AAA family ATPase [Caldilineaceae bacterium SB0661_bin_32]
MLKRIHIRDYKSLEDVEVNLSQLVVLFGPNAAGKSNFLDALQLLSKMGTSRTLKEAFDPPYRGKPLESFTIGEGGIKGLLEQESLRFSIEADLSLSDGVINAVNRQIREMRRPSGENGLNEGTRGPAPVRERELRYRIEVEMLPQSGVLRVTDEYLAALNAHGEPTGKRKPFIEGQGEKIHLRLEGQAHPTYYERYLDHSILSMPHYPPHYPHLVAARRELENWLFFYFEPRERMRAANPVKETRHLGLMGEELAAFLNTMKSLDASRFKAVEKALHTLMPHIDGIEVDVSDLGEVELRLKEGGVAMPARVLSEGTLRMLGLLALTGGDDPPALIGFEEPENGVHPRRVRLIAELLKTQEFLNQTQHIVTTHSPLLPDLLADKSLFVVSRLNRQTHIDPFATGWGPLGRGKDIDNAFCDDQEELPVSTRILRGDFDA